jgi:hypothetical protein
MDAGANLHLPPHLGSMPERMDSDRMRGSTRGRDEAATYGAGVKRKASAPMYSVTGQPAKRPTYGPGPRVPSRQKVDEKPAQPRDARPIVDSKEVADLRKVLSIKVRPAVEACIKEGAVEMVPEVHGYALSRIRDDFKRE